MVFNSISYLMFLPLVFLSYILVSERYKWLVLLVASYLFYGFMMRPVLLVVLTAVIIATFAVGWRIHQSNDPKNRKTYLWAGIGINLSLLIYFKYLGFITENINNLLDIAGAGIAVTVSPLMVSIGLSFYIFQAISYLTDIYFRMLIPEANFGHFALYMAFFPKLLQGPIERGGTLLPQLKIKYEYNYANVRDGLLLFAWGLFKKVVIADRLAIFVDSIYNNAQLNSGTSLLVATYFYAFQMYADFSGYTDMALGTARLFNIKLTDNFNCPYFARTTPEFWRRWHITLSRWILDYIFEPLQMKFRNLGKAGAIAAILIAFLICGLWHGASWCYVAWGAIHGIYLALSMIYAPSWKKLYKYLGLDKTATLRVWQTLLTFHLVCFSYIFFRANTISDAIYIATHIFSGGTLHVETPAMLIYGLMGIIILVAVEIKKEFYPKSPSLFHNTNWLVRYASFATLLITMLLFGVFDGGQFIYFKF